jgi:dihydroorotase
MGASASNIDELESLEGLPGTPGIKIFAGSSTGTLLVDSEELLRNVLLRGVRPCPVHSEDEARLRERKSLLSASPHVREHPVVRDAEAARLCTERLIRLCEQTGRPVHILHVSTLDELPLLREAKEKGLPVTCEVTPQHLTFSAADYETLGTRVQMNPPIRMPEHRAALWEALDEGLFDVFGSDHAPHTIEEKAEPYPKSPSGMPGVQTMLPVLLDFWSQGKIGLEKIVRMTSERPAALYGLRDRGRIEPGAWADLAVVDLKTPFVVSKDWLKSKCGWSPYEDRKLVGRPVHTIVNGQVVVRDSAPVAPAGKMVEYVWK